MCGIFCTIIHNRNPFLSEIAKKGEFKKNNPQFAEFYEHFQNRGPDHYDELLVEVSPCTVLQFAGCVLWTQGSEPVVQPFSCEDGNVLLWNGDIFSGSLASEENDTKTLYKKLTETSKEGSGIPEVFATIRGPYSFIYYEKSSKTLYFGRDVIGRHSLLIGFTQRSITISSIACRNVEGFSEIPAIGIFAYNLEKDGDTPLTLYPWSQISESILDFPYLLPRQSQQNFQTGHIIQTYIEPPRSEDYMYWTQFPIESGTKGTKEYAHNKQKIQFYLPAWLGAQVGLLQFCSQLRLNALQYYRTNKVPLATDLDMWTVQDQDSSLGELLGKLTLSNSKTRIKKTMTSLMAKSTIQILVEDLLTTLKKSVQFRVEKQPKLCKNCVKLKITTPEKDVFCNHAKVAILFSGGLDSAVLASLTHKCLPQGEPIDLLNVAFEVPQKCSDNKRTTSKKESQLEISYNVPDRLTGLSTLEELKLIHPERNWNFIKINVTLEELKKQRDDVISDLIYPLNTVLDDSLGCALWFASRGRGLLHDSNEAYISPARIVISGIGADEQLGGYMRHRSTLKYRGGWEGLDKELQYELRRISQRNLGRDDRIASDHGRQLRMPFLDEDVINYLSFLPPWQRCFPVDSMPPGIGDKLLLRLAAWELGFRQAANFPKRAMQFGSRIANSKEKGSNVSERLSQKQ